MPLREGFGAARTPPEMSKSFIPSMKDGSRTGGEYSGPLVSKKCKHRSKHESQNIPLDTGAVVVAASANTYRLSAIFEAI